MLDDASEELPEDEEPPDEEVEVAVSSDGVAAEDDSADEVTAEDDCSDEDDGTLETGAV